MASRRCVSCCRTWDEYAAIPYRQPRPVTLPWIHIHDRPRYPWRGAMLDVARHFFSVEDVKHEIDLLALLKMNRLHLHLADDQGWRIEIEKWPALTTIGGATEVGGGAGGFYTRAQYADLVDYAAQRFVTIVPEIDMPGHINAAMASYPELNCDNVAKAPYTKTGTGVSALCVDKEVTYQFLDDVIGEIAALTPGPYFHIGGDEVRTLSPDQYRTFVERIQALVAAHGKTMIGWDEVAATSLLPTSIVQHWRPSRRAAGAGASAAPDFLPRRSRLSRHEIRGGHRTRPDLGRAHSGPDRLRLGPGGAGARGDAGRRPRPGSPALVRNGHHRTRHRVPDDAASGGDRRTRVRRRPRVTTGIAFASASVRRPRAGRRSA